MKNIIIGVIIGFLLAGSWVLANDEGNSFYIDDCEDICNECLSCQIKVTGDN